MQKTSHHSYKQGTLPKGCKLCIQGRKSVFFITGICPEHCFYCPISDKKFGKDVIYINEWPTKEWNDIKKEIKLCKSKGAGITGGDPLARLERTLNFIKKLKKEFGKNFHIHLYTPLTLVNVSTLKKLYKAGLDEIRFHPNLETLNKSSWKKIQLAQQFEWQVGVEIPVLPNKELETKQLIDFLIKINIKFINLNELEYSDTNAMHMEGKKLITKNELSYAIKGSEKLALKLLKYIEKTSPKTNVHYCTAKLKDKIQMRNRIKLRASSIKQPFDRISEDGTLIRGAIYPDKKKDLKQIKRLLEKEFKIDLTLDKGRLLTSEKIIRKIASQIQPKRFKLAIIEEYPTFDKFLVEKQILS